MSDRILEIKLNRVPTTAMEWNQQVFSKINEFIRIVDGAVSLQPSVELPIGTVSDEMFRESVGVSVVGRAASSTGPVADITAGGDNRFLSRHAGALAFSALVDADIPAGIARDSEVTAAIGAHVSLPDPHTQYRLDADTVTYAEITGKPAALALTFSGTGTPEGAVTASIGSTFHRTDGGAGTSFYVKESGAGNTGWIGK